MNRERSCRWCRKTIPTGKLVCSCDRAKAEHERIMTFGPAMPA